VSVTSVRVVIVDDSAYVRKVFKEILSRSPVIEVVGTARDGQEALDLVEELRPDVVTCDLNMPTMDGVEFVRTQMARRPVAIVISSIAAESAEQVLAALEAGAIDFVQKPTALATEKLLDISADLIEKVKVAAQAPLGVRAVAGPDPHGPLRTTPRPPGRADVLVLGASTGGPQALKLVLSQLPADWPIPVALVLHMPVGYTELYARKLDEVCALHALEAKGDEPVTAGTILVAPAGRHLTFRRDADGVVRTQLDVHPLDTPHRPAVDVLFQSAADTFGERVLAVVLTGMGSDGRAGAAWIKARGGMIITEAEDSCVVYGMPRSVVEAGLSDYAAPLELISQAIMERA
jgi:two-component system, chemotaxis family, protein-glutamate methylesterase/glutaminase